ncbi:MAG TPA: SMR family transporter [Candidatus Peribacteraceae bacterium]|nr:SMR family transporter [Candidatus Peribacteraceae bacterium]
MNIYKSMKGMAGFPWFHQAIRSSTMLYIIVFLILVMETTAMSFLKEYSETSGTVALGLGIACYMGVSLLLIRSFRYEGMGIVNVLWSAFSVIFVVAVGIFLFQETISGIETIGIAFVLSGVVLLRSRQPQDVTRGGRCLHQPATLP